MTERKVILSMQMTFDGNVAGPNDEMDWMKNSKEEWKDMFKDSRKQTPICWAEKCTRDIQRTGNRF